LTFLRPYQDDAYAERYKRQVECVRAVEVEVRADSTELTEAVARNYFKLLAYKDEYEIARLYTQTGFLEQLRMDYQGRFKLRLHFSPPWIAGIDSDSGRPKKYAFGSWILGVLRVLTRLRFLRGTPLDLFSYTKERRLERQLIVDYEVLLAGLCEELDELHLAMAVELASMPEHIRGYGPVKEAAVEMVRLQREERVAAWSELRERLGRE